MMGRAILREPKWSRFAACGSAGRFALPAIKLRRLRALVIVIMLLILIPKFLHRLGLRLRLRLRAGEAISQFEHPTGLNLTPVSHALPPRVELAKQFARFTTDDLVYEYNNSAA